MNRDRLITAFVFFIVAIFVTAFTLTHHEARQLKDEEIAAETAAKCATGEITGVPCDTDVLAHGQ